MAYGGWGRESYGAIPWGLEPATPTPTPTAGPDLKQAIVEVLSGHAGFAAIAGQRIFPKTVPESQPLPALTYRYMSTVRATKLQGAAGMKWVRFRFEVLSYDEADTESVSELMRNRFQGIPGLVGGLKIHFCQYENEVDTEYPPTEGSDAWTFSKQFDLRFKVSESVPTNT